MTRLIFVCLAFLHAPLAYSQFISNITVPQEDWVKEEDESNPQVKFANTITAAELKAHIDIIASDAYEGRETGHPGSDMAAEYLSNYYNSLGLPKVGVDNSYMQAVAFTWSSWSETNMIINKKPYRHLWDFLSFPSKNNAMPPIMTDEIVFMGYGIDDDNYTDYKSAKVKDKVIMIYEGDPVSSDGISQVTGSSAMSNWDTDKKLIKAAEAGVKLVLIISSDIKKMLSENRRKLLGPTMQLGNKLEEKYPFANHIYISSSIAQEIWGAKQESIINARDNAQQYGSFKAITMKTLFSVVTNKKQSLLQGNNVLGFVEGSDKKEEVIVVSAHYDHIGKKGDEVYNGADDNGSGTCGVMEIAQAFKEAKDAGHGPSRSILFLHVTGEEKGLLGSAYYADNPIYSLEHTVANVNVDMIGRVDERYADNPAYIYVIGSDRLSTDLHKINEQANKKYAHLTLDYTYNSEDDPNRYYFRSDHYNFAEKGIPAIFFFNGVHEDYHMATDTPDKILFEKMANVAKLIFHTTWELANRKERIQVDVK